MIRKLRMSSGLVLLVYVTVHLINHSMGVVSLRAMEAMLEWVHPLWTSLPGTVAIYGAFLVHLTLALFALWQRRTLKLPRLEALQYLLGFSIPMLAAVHITGTRINDTFLAGDGSHYLDVLMGLWLGGPITASLQIALLFAAWTHMSIGLRFWLRLRPWYDAAAPLLYAVALLLPVVALLGVVAGERDLNAILSRDPGLITRTLASQVQFGSRPLLTAIAWGIRAALLGAVVVVILTRFIRHRWRRRQGVSRISYPGGRAIDIPRGFTVLDASQLLGIAHPSICGGKGRCSTCRVRVRAELHALPAPSEDEQRVLHRIGAPPDVRLACQLRPRGPVDVSPLLSAPKLGRSYLHRPIHADGVEQEVVVLFADLRDFTRLAEARLPYDVVFIVNRYCQEMGEAIEDAGGYVDKFIGDGVMALFGLNGSVVQSAGQAVAAARTMRTRLDNLNVAFAGNLGEPLRMGIGIHVGQAIVGEIGYGRTRSLTAVGDTVNIASRLQALSKDHGCDLLLSEALLQAAGLDPMDATRIETDIRGRVAPMAIYTFPTIGDLPAKWTAGEAVSTAV